jgi:hypothetical protein
VARHVAGNTDLRAPDLFQRVRGSAPRSMARRLKLRPLRGLDCILAPDISRRFRMAEESRKWHRRAHCSSTAKRPHPDGSRSRQWRRTDLRVKPPGDAEGYRRGRAVSFGRPIREPFKAGCHYRSDARPPGHGAGAWCGGIASCRDGREESRCPGVATGSAMARGDESESRRVDSADRA